MARLRHPRDGVHHFSREATRAPYPTFTYALLHLSNAIGPLLYLYTRLLMEPQCPLRPRQLLHFVPVLVAVMLLAPGEPLRVERKPAWRIDLATPWNGGVLSSAGDLVFQGNGDRRFVAYAADSGEAPTPQPGTSETELSFQPRPSRSSASARLAR